MPEVIYLIVIFGLGFYVGKRRERGRTWGGVWDDACDSVASAVKSVKDKLTKKPKDEDFSNNI